MRCNGRAASRQREGSSESRDKDQVPIARLMVSIQSSTWETGRGACGDSSLLTLIPRVVVSWACKCVVRLKRP